jgi:hypothetical protein
MSGSRSTAKAIVLHQDDDVAVLVEELQQGAIVTVSKGAETISLDVRDALPLGHKIALRDLPAGHHVRKYGEVIGVLMQPVVAGEHVHVHNLASLRAHR